MESNSVNALETAGARRARNLSRLAKVARAMILLSSAWVGMQDIAFAQATSNGGDPLFCQPDEGTTFLIINGGSGLFTVNTDCYNNNIGTPPSNTPPGPTITTTQGGTLTLNLTAVGGNYTYTPPTPNFIGLDTFTIHVTTTWNATGGPGSAGGTFLARPGGADNVVVTLHVLPARFTLQSAGAATLAPVPTGFITGCGPQGNPGQGPASSVVVGCVTALGLAPFNETSSITTAHGTVTTVGSGAGEKLRYTPTAGFTGTDTFNFHIFGTNTDGSTALDSGNGAIPTNAANVLMQVTVNAPIVITNASPLPGGSQGLPYAAQTFAATGGFPGTSPAYTFTLASGTLPPGTTLTNGVLSGTPTATGTFNFTIQAADAAVFSNPTLANPAATISAPNTVTKAFQLTVGTAPISTVAAPTLGFWGMALLCGSLLLFGAGAITRRQA